MYLHHKQTESSEQSGNWRSWWGWRELRRNASQKCSEQPQFKHSEQSPTIITVIISKHVSQKSI